MDQAVSNPVFTSPGRLINICGIQAAVTENHNENFYFWQKFGIKNATMLHVDAHSDMFGPAPHTAETLEDLPEDYYDSVDIAQFICPAFHYGIVSRIYRNDPHAVLGKRFIDVGCRDGNERRKLETYVTGDCIFWTKDQGVHVADIHDFIMPQYMKLERGFLLDIDLDAFCCNVLKDGGDGINGYEKRVKETCGVLRDFNRPGLITITRSQGTGGLGVIGRTVPVWLVDKVEEETIEQLEKAYAA